MVLCCGVVGDGDLNKMLESLGGQGGFPDLGGMGTRTTHAPLKALQHTITHRPAVRSPLVWRLANVVSCCVWCRR